MVPEEIILKKYKKIWDGLGVCWGPYQTFKELVQNDERVSSSNPMFAIVSQEGIGKYLTLQ